MSLFIKKILFPVLIIIFAIVLILYYTNDFQNTKTTTNYTLRSYKNTVALFNGEEVIKIYNNIVLNTLPEKDIQNFNNGISVTTPTQAELLLEDYDS